MVPPPGLGSLPACRDHGPTPVAGITATGVGREYSVQERGGQLIVIPKLPSREMVIDPVRLWPEECPNRNISAYSPQVKGDKPTWDFTGVHHMYIDVANTT